MTGELFFLLLLGLFALYWQDELKAREIAISAARSTCRNEGLQLLDDTVAQNGLRLIRHDQGRLCLQRSFAFEYSRSGDDRYPGYITLRGHEVVLLDLAPRPPDRPPTLQ